MPVHGIMHIALTLLAVFSAPIVLSGSASASMTATTDVEATHCVVKVVGAIGGVLLTGPEKCFRSEWEAASYEPFPELGNSRSAQSLSTTIGLHYTDLSYSGSSIRIVGTVCSGGVWYATASWNNNIESSQHYCGSAPTTFYDNSNCTGAARSITSASSTLIEMNNRASCVKYG